jgi:hypothetical protein
LTSPAARDFRRRRWRPSLVLLGITITTATGAPAGAGGERRHHLDRRRRRCSASPSCRVSAGPAVVDAVHRGADDADAQLPRFGDGGVVLVRREPDAVAEPGAGVRAPLVSPSDCCRSSSPWAVERAEEFRRLMDSRDDVAAVTPGVFRESRQADRVYLRGGGSGHGEPGRQRIRQLHPARQHGRDGRAQRFSGNRWRTATASSCCSTAGATRASPERRNTGSSSSGATRCGSKSDGRRARADHQDASTVDLLRNPTPPNLGELSWRIGLPVSALLLSAAGDSAVIRESRARGAR